MCKEVWLPRVAIVISLLSYLAKISKIAREYDAKTYLCTNIILKESQIIELKNNLEKP